MSVPEMILQRGVERAWQFLQEHDYILGAILRHFPVEKQESYRKMVVDEKPSILFQNPHTRPTLPSFVISLMAESENQQYVGDDGLDVHMMPEAMPFPPDQPEDFKRDGYYGLDFNDPEMDIQTRYLQRGGDRSTEESRHHPVIGQNTGIQRHGGDEQYEQADEVQRLYNAVTHFISTRAVQDNIQMGIEINTTNAEKTYVYYRLLKNVLRRFHIWFHVNGIQNPVWSGSDLLVNEELQPTASGPGAFKRQLLVSFQHEDRIQEIEAVLAGWMIEVEMVTPNGKGGLDTTPVATIEPDPKSKG